MKHMFSGHSAKFALTMAMLAASVIVSGCTTTDQTAALSSAKATTKTASANKGNVIRVNGVKTYTYTPKDRECLERAMFFEANRSSQDGLVAVGTVVINRLLSKQYPDTICGVVGQKNQFAPGVLTRKMNSKALPDVQKAADDVLKGKRHPAAKNSMFFHTAGLKFPYKNMHYVLVAGGNAFYEKRNKDGSLQSPVPTEPYNLAMIYTPQNQAVPSDKAYNVTTPQTAEEPAAIAAPATMIAAAEPKAPVQAQQNETAQVAELQVPLPTATPNTAAPAASSLAYAPAAENVDAIGAFLLTQQRPTLN
ncbi:spore germination cell wall hydrolase CwlJ-like protein [Paenochrobactrum gallinarii]|uniref:Spore germination cell wall hydrolase CwlJ-like protein n=2 Tax=Paenochrobactrum gallinarii TaxID=643673 RepID=A0A841LXA0_9HYPH|nr:spore germination cell wall hydrolase CwlJ-like protein [Paenochrobactrum gallinarii]